MFSTILTAILALSTLSGIAPAAEPAVWFAPDGRPAAAVVTELDAAKTSIDLAAFSLTHPAIIDALARAAARNVKVRVITDPRNEAAAVAPLLRPLRYGVQHRTDAAHKLFHHKYLLIDSATLMVGSFNFTISADRRNAENIIRLSDPALIRRFAHDFADHWNHVRPFEPKRTSRPDAPAPAAALPPPKPAHAHRSH